MASIPGVNTSVTPSPVDANRQAPAERARNTSSSPEIVPTAQPKFVDRRRNRDRRKETRQPLVDTRRNKDRRRTGRLDVEI